MHTHFLEIAKMGKREEAENEQRQREENRENQKAKREEKEEKAAFWIRVRQRTAEAADDFECARKRCEDAETDDQPEAQRAADHIYDARFEAIIAPFKGHLIPWKVCITMSWCVYWA